MAFTIDPDFLFPKVGAPASRKDREAPTGDSGKDFASTLLRASPAPDDSAASETGTKETDTDQPSQLIPLLYPAPDTAAGNLEAENPEGDTNTSSAEASVTLTTKAGQPGAEAIAGQPGDVPAGAIKRDDSADEAKNTDGVPPVVPVQTSAPEAPAPELAMPAPATSEPDAMETAVPQVSKPQQDSRAASAPAQTDTPATSDGAPPEIRAMAVQTAAPPEAKPTGKQADTAATSEIKVDSAASAPARVQATGKPAPESAQKGRFRLPADGEEALAEVATSESGSGDAPVKTTKVSGTPPSPDAAMLAAGQPAQSGPAPSAPTAQPAQLATNGMTPANAIITASPTDTVRIISESIASPDDRQDRITVQLDPPELGRVSIDFKFNAHGLQHVTITGESPEALRQLRLMHFELTQALENNGLSSENMTFQQQASHQQHQQAQSTASRLAGAAPAEAATPQTTAPPQPRKPVRVAGGGLDIRL